MAKGREFRNSGVRGGALSPRLGHGPFRPWGGRLGRPARFPSLGVPDASGASEALPGPFLRGFAPAGCQHSRLPLLSTVLTDSIPLRVAVSEPGGSPLALSLPGSGRAPAEVGRGCLLLAAWERSEGVRLGSPAACPVPSLLEAT